MEIVLTLAPTRTFDIASFFVYVSIFSFAALHFQGLRASPQSAGFSFLNGRVLGGLDDLRQVEAKYAAFLFKQQLTTFLENIYGMIRDNLKKYFPIAWIVYSGNSSQQQLI